MFRRVSAGWFGACAVAIVAHYARAALTRGSRFKVEGRA